MSDDLLEAAKLDIPYLQSLVDLWSFYYVAQWAAVFNNVDFPGNTPLPVKLAELRRQISGSHADRALGTLKITGPVMDQIEYGQFLADCYSILSQWRSKLNQLTADWRAARVDAIIDGDARCLYFREYTNRGILELVQLVQQKFPGGESSARGSWVERVQLVVSASPHTPHLPPSPAAPVSPSAPPHQPSPTHAGHRYSPPPPPAPKSSSSLPRA